VTDRDENWGGQTMVDSWYTRNNYLSIRANHNWWFSLEISLIIACFLLLDLYY